MIKKREEIVVVIKEAMCDSSELETPEAAPLDEPWFWPDGIQPLNCEEPGELNPSGNRSGKVLNAPIILAIKLRALILWLYRCCYSGS